MFDSEFEKKPKSIQRVALSQQRWLLATILVLAVTAGFAAFYVLREIETQMERSASAVSDNRTWVISQLEVDVLKLNASLTDILLTDGEVPIDQLVEAVRLRYDVLFSRVALIQTSRGLTQTVLSSSEEWKALSAPDGLIAELLPVIDGPDEGIIAAAPEIYQKLDALQPGIRRAMIDTLLDMIAEGEQRRNNLRDTLRVVAIATLWLFFGVLTLMTGLYLQGRARMRHASILERAVDNLRNTINSALDAVLILDSSGRIIGSNRATDRMFGGVFEPRHHYLQEYLRDANDPSVPLALADVPHGRRSRLNCLRLDGREFPAEASLATGSTSSGDPISVVFLRDISEQLAYEDSLAEARNAALAADESKARFLAVMSHEMRTPLNGLLSAVDLLDRTTTLDQEQKWLADIIRSCGQTTLEQVNNVLQLTRLSSEEADEYPASSFDLVSIVRDKGRIFSADAARNGTTLQVEAPDKVIGVQLPLQLLRRALANLLSNAVKFTENGFITLRLVCEPGQEPGQVCIALSVQDTGIGIEPGNLERIFRNFETLDSSYVRVREGSGLGLGIAKLSVEAMGGTITAESTPGKGSCFTIRVQAPTVDLHAEEGLASPAEPMPLGALDVLLAEDNLINRALLTRQLEGLGATVTAVVDGLAAFEAAQTHRFDLILMDVSMPRMDGLTATSRIRAEGMCRDVPVIVITAQASLDRVGDYTKSGVTEVLTKPARLDDLVAVIREHTTSALSNPSSPARRPAEDALLGDADHIQSLIEDFGTGYLGKMLESFDREAEKMLGDVAEAFARDDLAAVGKQAHSVAGAAAALGLCGLHKALIALENTALEKDSAKAAVLFTNINDLVPRSVAYLRAALTSGLPVAASG